MNNSSDLNRGRNIIPRARKGIHSVRDNYPRPENMGKYGLNSEQNIPENGIDEIDNVMSKMPYTNKTLISRKPPSKKTRRHSYHYIEETDDDDSDENILSKSSPALSSSRMEFDSAMENTSVRSNNNDSSSSNHMLLESFRGSQNISSRRPSQELGKVEGCKFPYWFITIIFGALAVIWCSIPSIEPKKVDIYNKHSFYNDVKNLGAKYKVPDDSILKLKIGITTISENEDTGSFIFTYDSKNQNFNPMKFDQFVEDISATASKYLRNNTKIGHHLIINPTSLTVQTEKEFMNKYQKDVDKTGVMLIKDVDNIPSDLAMAFHYYCDEYNPLVKKSAIFLTLNLAKCHNGSEQKSTHEYIEKCLARKWKNVDQDKIGPLLTRVVNIVVEVS